MVPMTEKQLADNFSKENVDAIHEGLGDITLLSVECAACDVAEVYSPPRL